MTDAEIIEVVTAHKEGKKIESRSPDTVDWRACEFPNWDFYRVEFRVAPGPRKLRDWWLDFKDQARHAEVHSFNYCGDCVHVQEVEGETSGEPTVITSEVKAFDVTQPRKPRDLIEQLIKELEQWKSRLTN